LLYLSSRLLVFFIAATIWDEKFGLIAFILLSFSPISIFYSQTTFHHPLGAFFGYTSLCLFFYGLVNKKGFFMLLSSITFCLGFSTFYPIGALLPVMGIIYILFRFFNKTNLDLYCVTWLSIALAGISLNFAHFLSSFTYYYNYPITVLDPFDITKFSVFIIEILGGVPIIGNPFIFIQLLVGFIGISLIIIPFSIILLIKGDNNQKYIFTGLLLCLIRYLIYYSFLIRWQADRQLIMLDFPLEILIAGILRYIFTFLTEIEIKLKQFNISVEIVVTLCLITLFLFQTVLISSYPQFKGTSAIADYIYNEGANSIATDSPVALNYYLLHAGFEPTAHGHNISYSNIEISLYWGNTLEEILNQNYSEPTCFCPDFIVIFRFSALTQKTIGFLNYKYDKVLLPALESGKVEIATLYSATSS